MSNMPICADYYENEVEVPVANDENDGDESPWWAPWQDDGGEGGAA